MTVIGAFYWDTGKRTINYLVLKDGDTTPPRTYVFICHESDYKEKIKRAVNDFFGKLLRRSKNKKEISVVYKTYFDSPEVLGRIPIEETVLVDDAFVKQLYAKGLQNRAHKVRFLLRNRKKITAFRHFIEDIFYSGHRIKSNVYKLWQLAFRIHASPSSYQNAIKKIYRFVYGQSIRTKENQQKFEKLWNSYFLDI